MAEGPAVKPLLDKLGVGPDSRVTPGNLDRLGGLEPFMERDGSVWVVYPKGREDLKVVDVIRAGVATGLVDNKVVRFSDTHTALRFVIPRARR